jgi:hypothetical protein
VVSDARSNRGGRVVAVVVVIVGDEGRPADRNSARSVDSASISGSDMVEAGGQVRINGGEADHKGLTCNRYASANCLQVEEKNMGVDVIGRVGRNNEGSRKSMSNVRRGTCWATTNGDSLR